MAASRASSAGSTSAGSSISGHHRICAALDVSGAAAAHALASKLHGHVGHLKVGLELFVGDGYAAIDQVRQAAPDTPIFLDLKLCDIPETVARAVRSAARSRPQLLTVHASGGEEMLRRAVAAAAEASGGSMRLLAVTVLTSLDLGDLRAMGVAAESVGDHALRLAQVAWRAGVTGFVCSPQEVARFRAELPDAYLVTPGVRPAGGAGSDDQKRVETPAAAIRAGADLLVIGRPLRDVDDPAGAARAIAADIDAALRDRRRASEPAGAGE